jgi:hypothetical protein
MRVVLGGAADVFSRFLQSLDHAIELVGDLCEFRNVVLLAERAGAAALAHDAGAVGEAAEAASDAPKGCEREERHREVDDAGDLDLGRCPVGGAEVRSGQRRRRE